MKKFNVAFNIIVLALVIWIGASWFDIAAHNLDAVPVYWSGNFFALFL